MSVCAQLVFEYPLYIKLYKSEKNNIKVESAVYMGIHTPDVKTVLGNFGGKKGFKRSEYQTTLDSLDMYIDKFASALRHTDFSCNAVSLNECIKCNYSDVCRKVYSLENNDVYIDNAEDSEDE